MKKSLTRFVFALLIASVLTFSGLAQSPGNAYWQQDKKPEKPKERPKDDKPKDDRPKEDKKKP